MKYNKNTSNEKAVRIHEESNFWNLIKVFCISVILLFELALIFFIHMRLAEVLWWYIGFSFFASFGCCLYVLSSNKSGNSKTVWTVFLLLFFYVGYTIFILSDENICFAKHKKKYRKIFSRTNDLIDNGVIADDELKDDSLYLKQAGNFPTYQNTDMKYFSSGALLFDDILESLKQAKKFIFIEFFIIGDGILLERVLRILEEKVANGVDVRIIYDSVGCSRKLSEKTIKRIKRAGIKIHEFNRLVPVFSVSMNFRDHRKIVVIDGEISYTGGSNLSDEYVNEKRLYGYWKDTGFKMVGDATRFFTLAFLRQWEFVCGDEMENCEYSQYILEQKNTNKTSNVILYLDGLEYEEDIGKSVYTNMIASAREKIYIMTPYFIVDHTIENLLISKAMCGADVRIVLPRIPDKKVVYSLSSANARKLTDKGVKVYLMDGSFVHSKLVLTENEVAVGSVNMDMRSFYQQFECGIVTTDTEVMKDVEADFNETFSLCTDIREVVKYNFLVKRVYNGLLRLFSPLM